MAFAMIDALLFLIPYRESIRVQQRGSGQVFELTHKSEDTPKRIPKGFRKGNETAIIRGKRKKREVCFVLKYES